MKIIIKYLIGISMLLLAFSCGGSGGGEGVLGKPSSQVRIIATFQLKQAASIKPLASTVNTIRYAVSGPGMTNITGTVPVINNLVEFSLSIPNGLQRYFVIEALDKDNNVRYAGDALRDLDGTPATIEITLIEKVLNISGTWQLIMQPQSGAERNDCFYIQQYDNYIYFTWWPEEHLYFNVNGSLAYNLLALSGSGFYYRDQITVNLSAATDEQTIQGTYNFAGNTMNEVGNWTATRGICKKISAIARQVHFKNGGYAFDFYVWDYIPEGITITSAYVTGPHVASLSLQSQGPSEYQPWWSNAFLDTEPVAGDIYTFAVTYSDGSSATYNATVKAMLVDFPTLLSPSDGAIVDSPALTFSWQPPSCACQGYYRIVVSDSEGNWIWSPYLEKTATSVAYNYDGQGTPLVSGHTYSWFLVTFDDPPPGPDNYVWVSGGSFTVK